MGKLLLKVWSKIKSGLQLASFICFASCNKQVKEEISSNLITLQDGPTLMELYDSLELDSIRVRAKIDSLLLFKTSDSLLERYLDQCYWPYHIRHTKFTPVYNKQGFSHAEADLRAKWLFERKTVDCGDLQTKLAEFNGIMFLDSTCTHCFLFKVDPFDCPFQYVTLDSKRDLIFTESYARSGILGLPRLIKKYHLNYLDEIEVAHLLDSLSKAPSRNNYVGLDGMSLDIGFTTANKTFEIERWQKTQELSGLWRFIERKIGLKLPQCKD